VRLLTVPGVGEGAPGRRSRARTAHGRVVRATAPTGHAPAVRAGDLHLPATVTAAAPHQRTRGHSGPGLSLLREDLRHAVREGREGNLILFVVDASGSMSARSRMAAVSGAVVSLLRDAYQRRDKVGLVTFRAGSAELLLPPTTSVPTAVARLARLRTGGRTPLADALRAAALLAAEGVASVVVDCESGPVRLGMASRLAAAAGAELVGVGELSAERVVGVVRAAGAAA
jgi:magnesium chelatase subunit D